MKRLSTQLIFVVASISLLIAGVGCFSLFVTLEPHGVDPLKRQAYKEKIQEVKLREALATVKTSAQPRVELPVREFDFGLLDPGSSAEHKFLVRNAGDAPLTLDVVHTSCKCTVGEIKTPVLLPGEETAIRLQWNSGQAAEKYVQTATIRTNDPRQKQIEVAVSGTIKSSLANYPTQFLFGSVDTHANAESSIWLFSQIYQDFSIESVLCDDTPANFEVAPATLDQMPANLGLLSPTSAVRLTITRVASKRGSFQGEFTIHGIAEDGSSIEKKISYQGKTRAPITFHSPELRRDEGFDLGTIIRGQRVEKNVVVRMRSAESTLLQILDVQPPQLQAELTRQQSNEYRLRITIPETCKPVIFNRDSYRGFIQVGSPTDPNISNWLPVWGAVVDVQ